MQIVRLATPVLWLSPWLHNIWIFNFQFTSTFKIFVRSRRDWKEKMPERIPTVRMYYICPFCFYLHLYYAPDKSELIHNHVLRHISQICEFFRSRKSGAYAKCRVFCSLANEHRNLHAKLYYAICCGGGGGALPNYVAVYKIWKLTKEYYYKWEEIRPHSLLWNSRNFEVFSLNVSSTYPNLHGHRHWVKNSGDIVIALAEVLVCC